MELTKRQKPILAANGHLLVTGGPGSGKTTVSIYKAADIAASHLKAEQKVLFLSFARPTVSRVVEAIEHEHEIPRELKKRIRVETYHSFFWQLLKSQGYLVGLPRPLSVLTPSDDAIALSEIRAEYEADNKLSDDQKAKKKAREDAERLRLSRDEGRICFDLFAPFVGDVLHGSAKVRELVSNMYPYIILDEFQDTDAAQWHVVKALGQNSTLIALADPEQQIYQWIPGVDPERLNHFSAEFQPKEFDLKSENHRSPGTDIASFGNDVLRGQFREEHPRNGVYAGVNLFTFEANSNQAMASVVGQVLKARGRLIDSRRKDWSLVILVPTKKFTRLVSDTLRTPPRQMPTIQHTATVELEGAILAAELIAFLLQREDDGRHFVRFIDLVCAFFRGKGGSTPTKGALREAQGIRNAYEKLLNLRKQGKRLPKNSILNAMILVYTESQTVKLTGDPDQDWRAVRAVLENGSCNRLKLVGEEARYVRLLDRGAQLRLALSEDWREHGSYRNAFEITRLAFVQEHFATAGRPETGVIVMNMHKAKGKQFDEVIIFEGWPKVAKRKIVSNPDRILWGNSRDNDNDEARQNFRVSITRGKSQVTILTPKTDPCLLLLPDHR